jgi:hypothetical protein
MDRFVHFLHIGKTGGTAIKNALAPIAAEHGLILHTHQTRLWDVPEGDGVFFFLRDPVRRFVSGFNSRLRMGRPRLNSKWSEGEAKAFSTFTTPNALAEAISSRTALLRLRAGEAMREIRHVNTHFSTWLGEIDYVLARKSSIVHVGFQESLEEDFQAIKTKLLLPDVRLPVDDRDSHATPSGYATELSELGRQNIERWYAEDIAWMRRLRDSGCA